MFSDPRLPSDRRRPDAVTLVWLAGAALAIVAYAVGPDRLVAGAFDVFNQVSWYVDWLIHNLTTATLSALRAAAIGLFGVYVGLSLLAINRRGHGMVGLLVVTVVFLGLVWGAEGDYPAANLRWAVALVIAALSAFGATRRLGRPPAPRP